MHTAELLHYFYDEFGQFEHSEAPEGVIRSLKPIETIGLVSLSSGLGTPSNPAPVVKIADVMAEFTDGENHTTKIKTNRLGDSTVVEDPLMRIISLDRDADSNITKITRADGTVIDQTFDSRGNLLTTTNTAIAATSTFQYEPQFNRVTQIQDAESVTTLFRYDSNGNLQEIEDAATGITSFTYDSIGRITELRDVLNKLTTFSYDPVTGNVATITDPLLRTMRFEYDAVGNVVAVVNAESHRTEFSYDVMNRLTLILDANLGTTSYTYDDSGNLGTVTDSRTKTTAFGYDGLDRLISITNPLTQVRGFQYDRADNLRFVSEPDLTTIEFIYDAANQLTSKVLPGPETVTFGYDPTGNISLAEDADSRLTFLYDGGGRLIESRTSDPPNAAFDQPTTLITYQYDKVGNRTSFTGPAGTSATYSYDAPLRRLQNITNNFGEAFSFGYDPLSRRTSLAFPNATTTTLGYDDASQLTRIAHAINATPMMPFLSFDYLRDNVGNIARITELDRSTTYTYDNLNQLITATPTIGTAEFFTYDAVGNRITSNTSSTHVHDDANRLSEDDTFTYAYDAKGNLTLKQDKVTLATTTYTYDAENR